MPWHIQTLTGDVGYGRQPSVPEWRTGQGVSLRSDNGCQPTSLAFMRACNTLEIHQAFTSYNNPKGNADTERVMRTFKEECPGPRNGVAPLSSISALDAWIAHDNEHYLHSPRATMPRQFE